MYLRTLLLKEAHEPAYSGHQGIIHTLSNLARIAWWPHQFHDVKDFVRSCHSCQINKPANQAQAGLHQPLPVPEKYWELVSLDFMVRLPRTHRGYDAIAVFVDRLSKYVRIIPTKTDMSAIQFANVFQDTIFKHHGISKVLVSDRDLKFTSEFWTTLIKTLGTKLNMSSSYHPQTDGQTEIMSRHIIAYLRHYIAPLGKDWAKHLANAEFALNNHTSSTTGYTPFFLVNNRHPNTPLTLFHPKVNDKVPIIGEQSLTQWLLNRESARTAMRLAQDRMAVSANIHRRDLRYNIGDMV
jgi:hypothetical protein